MSYGDWTIVDGLTTQEPTYQNRLRVIGRRLDTSGYRSMAIFEIVGGFIVRALPADGNRPQALEFPFDEFPELLQHDIEGRGDGQGYQRYPTMFPTGYEDSLRAIGHFLDDRLASAVMICELSSYVLLAGMEPSTGASGHIAVMPFDFQLQTPDVQALLDESFSRRSAAASSSSRRRFF